MIYSPLTKDVVPSFILLAIQDNKVITYIYELKGDGIGGVSRGTDEGIEVQVSKYEYIKK